MVYYFKFYCRLQICANWESKKKEVGGHKIELIYQETKK